MHPQCCKTPDTCSLSYRDHLVGVGLGVDAIPSRAVTRNPDMPDEPCTVTRAREKWLTADRDAYKRLRDDGLHPRAIKGAAALEARAETRSEIERGYA